MSDGRRASAWHHHHLHLPPPSSSAPPPSPLPAQRGIVYRGLCLGAPVAVKLVILTSASGEHESSVSRVAARLASIPPHTNLLPTLSLRSLGGGGGAASGSVNTADGAGSVEAGSSPLSAPLQPQMAIELVTEYCDRGSLRQALDQGVFFDGEGGEARTEGGKSFDGEAGKVAGGEGGGLLV